MTFNILNVNKPEYYIGVDTYDKHIACYCLVKKIGNITEIVLSKTMRKNSDFYKEVDNLSKYFNASIVKDN